MKQLWWPTIALVLILAALFIPAAMAEESPTEYTSGDYRYTLQPDGTVAITGYIGSASTLSIPDTLDGFSYNYRSDYRLPFRSAVIPSLPRGGWLENSRV